MRAYDAIVVGGGIIGMAVALELKRNGMRVALLDRRAPGTEASWAAAGMLSPAPDSPDSLPLFPMARESLRMYALFVQNLEEATERSTGYRPCGSLEAFFGEKAEKERDSLVSAHRQIGLPTESISVYEARQFEPALSASLRAAAWLPNEAIVAPRDLMRAMLAACGAAGVEMRTQSEVQRILQEQGRAAGVETAAETIRGGNVILAMGCFTSLFPDLERLAPTRPVRGQMAALSPAGWHLQRTLRCRHGYLVPRDDGTLVAGSTLEHAGFAKEVTPGGLHSILGAALLLADGLAEAGVKETWAGLRPDTPDHLPILGPTETEGLYIATGHYRNGILLAPITALLMRELLTEEKTSLDISAFSPLRFCESAASPADSNKRGALQPDQRQSTTQFRVGGRATSEN